MTSSSGDHMLALITRLYPICRSITGNGVRESLSILREQIPLEIHEVPTGEKVFDWVIPKEWNIRDAWIKNANGERLIDFKESNLHVVSYSTPVRARMSFRELRTHLHTLPEQPDWIPYRTSYYKANWGFCLSERQLAQFSASGEYEVCIDSDLTDGSLTYGEYLLPGERSEEILISCHICHPSLADDNLSGIAVATAIAQALSERRNRYSYRFLFVPGSIGAITWLARNEEKLGRIRAGIVLTCIGDAAAFTYKQNRRGDAEIDRAFAHLLPSPGNTVPFSPYGYDERQYCSPGINLPVGCLMRAVHGTFPEYHKSADNLSFIRAESLNDSLKLCLEVFNLLEEDRTYLNNCPKGEPQLGRRGLYEGLNASANRREKELALLWVLNLSDGEHSLLDIAERAQLPFSVVREAATALAATDLLTPLET